MSTLPTPLTDWLTTHLGWPAAIFLVLAVVTVAGIGLAHCWRRTGRGQNAELAASRERDENRPEVEAWANHWRGGAA